MDWINPVSVLAAGALSYGAATRVDRRNARRSRVRNENEKRAVARLVYVELSAAGDLANRAIEGQAWPSRWNLRDETWIRNGPTLAWQIPEDEFRQLGHTYRLVRSWQDRVNREHATGPFAQMNINAGSEEMTALAELRANVGECLLQLNRHAFPDGREVEQDPDTMPPSWRAWRWRHFPPRG